MSQESTLIPNTNIEATELIHHLNKTKDSLVLSSEFTIHKVEIFNSEFIKIFEVSGNELKIPLQEIPLGRQSIAVFVNRKIIMLTLLRKQPYKKIKTKPVPEKKNEIRDTLIMEIPPQVIVDTIFKPPKYKEIITTEYDTMKVKNILNKKHTYIIENVVNETFDTINIGTINKPKDDVIIRKIPYDVSTLNNDFRVIKQTRDDFRKHNLRPNGTPYPEAKRKKDQ
jgi:hypothetical protein